MIQFPVSGLLFTAFISGFTLSPYIYWFTVLLLQKISVNPSSFHTYIHVGYSFSYTVHTVSGLFSPVWYLHVVVYFTAHFLSTLRGLPSDTESFLLILTPAPRTIPKRFIGRIFGKTFRPFHSCFSQEECRSSYPRLIHLVQSRGNVIPCVKFCKGFSLYFTVYMIKYYL
jgi:hypothetical protein